MSHTTFTSCVCEPTSTSGDGGDGRGHTAAAQSCMLNVVIMATFDVVDMVLGQFEVDFVPKPQLEPNKWR